MNNVTYINAGAGSGKTHTLTERLADLIEKDHINPEQVILTTFTVKAASEFKEKAKGLLFDRGLYAEALRLDQALVGTVHSVANALINKFWFKLGLPPAMGVMAEEDVDFYISQSLGELPKNDELKVLHGFAREFDIEYGYTNEKKGVIYDLWKEHLQDIIGYATNYEISDFGESKRKSVEYIKQFRQNGMSIKHSTEELQDLLAEQQRTLDNIKESCANNKRKAALRELRHGVYNPTVGWYKRLASLLGKTKKENGKLASAMNAELAGLWHSDLVYEKQKAYISLLFTLAERWQRRFTDFKKEKRVLDYNDMEKYLLKLTEIPSACEELAQSFHYLFVDEFQDSSPIQVKIFDRLSDLMEHTYWVGDYKQSIYGFRSSDIALVKAVVDNVTKQEKEHPKSGCTTETLEYSWRSLPPIVDVCNETFKRSFNSVLDEKNITLKKIRENKDNVESLRYIQIDEDNDITVAGQIAWLVSHEKINPNDIAVISRTNDPLNNLADVLQNPPYCLPINRASIPINDNNATLLVQALLQVVVSTGNNLAKATIAWLTEKDYTTSKLIDSKLEWDNDETNKRWEYLNGHPLIARLLTKRDTLRKQGLGAMVETMIIELGLYDVVKQWPDATWSASCLDVLINTAMTYEQHCLQMGVPATINGYIDYISLRSPISPGDAQGVQLLTYHACKGLQWKHVILLSLNNHPANMKKVMMDEIFGVQFCHEAAPTVENPYPNVYIRLLPFIYGTNTKVPDDIALTIQESEEYANAYRHSLEESSRLLYVGMTRAKDILTLAIEKPARGIKQLQWFEDINVIPNAELVGNKRADLLGVGIPFVNFTATAEEILSIEPYTTADAEFKHKKLVTDAETDTTYDVRYIAPSHVMGVAPVTQHSIIGDRITVNSAPTLDYAEVGNCIHQIYCSIDKQEDAADFVKKVVEAYDSANILPDAKAIVTAWNNLTNKLTEVYGRAITVYHERPFQLLSGEQVVTGSMDLVWKTDKGCVLVDFKSNPMSADTLLDPKSDHYVGLYGGQLNCYTAALKEAGEEILAKYIYYPISGLFVELGECAKSMKDSKGHNKEDMMPHRVYLMRWNPTISSFTLDAYRNAIKHTKSGFGVNWSLYEAAEAHQGDEYFMLRTGDDKAGIVFHGRFESEPYKGKDWAGSDKVRHYVDCSVFDFSGANDTAHISIEELQETIPSIDWTSGHSGELLTDEQAFALKRLWYENVDDIYLDD